MPKYDPCSGECDQNHTYLHTAAEEGDVQTIEKYALRKEYCSSIINQGNKYGHTPLHYAVNLKNIPDALRIIRALKYMGADMNAKDACGRQPIHQMMWQYEPSAEMLKLLIELGADVNGKGQVDSLPMQEAMLKEHIHLLEILLVNGANPNMQGEYNRTPMHTAAAYNLSEEENIELVNLLRRFGGSLYIEDGDGRTPRGYLQYCLQTKNRFNTFAFSKSTSPNVELLVKLEKEELGQLLEDELNKLSEAELYRIKYRY